MKFIDENGGEWEGTDTNDWRVCVRTITRTPPKKETNLDIASDILCGLSCNGPFERSVVKMILDVIDEKIAKAAEK